MVEDLDQALDLIRAGQANQGAEAWEKLFREGGKRSPTEALFRKDEYAAVLFECGLVDDAMRVDREICDELDEYESLEHPPVSPQNRQKLENDVRSRYAGELGSLDWEDPPELGDDDECSPVTEMAESETAASESGEACWEDGQTLQPGEASSESRYALLSEPSVPGH